MHFARGMIDRPDGPGTEIKVLPGDRVFAYTDGFIEEMDGDGTILGQEVFELLLTQMLDHDEPLEVLKKVLMAYLANKEQSDDMTIVELTC